MVSVSARVVYLFIQLPICRHKELGSYCRGSVLHETLAKHCCQEKLATLGYKQELLWQVRQSSKSEQMLVFFGTRVLRTSILDP